MRNRSWPAIGLGFLLLAACATFRSESRPGVPDEEARHRAALTHLIINNRTAFALDISYRTGTPPLQEVTLGRVPPVMQARVAPIPAGEPLVLVATRADGAEFTLPAKSYPIDQEWIWDVPLTAQFRRP